MGAPARGIFRFRLPWYDAGMEEYARQAPNEQIRAAPSSRMRFQFSLRALLMLVVVVAIYSFIALTIRERQSLFPTPAERRGIRGELDRLADEARAKAVREMQVEQETNEDGVTVTVQAADQPSTP